MKTSKITRRVYVAMDISLISPLCIAGGEVYTDADVIVNGNGEYFIPGTSLAGAFRNYLDQQKDQPGIFGFSKGETGRMSSVYFSDVILENSSIDIRDNVQLNDEKTVNNKFDTEIIEPGACGTIWISWIERENDPECDYEYMLASILKGIQNGEIRLGSNKNRGFGRIKVNELFRKEFDKDCHENWLAFLPNEKDIRSYDRVCDIDSICQSAAPDRYIRISVPLKQEGGISIRKYSTVPGKADFEHITSNGKSVIPGSSWNGAIRSDVKKILRNIKNLLDAENMKIEEILSDWFGSVGDRGKGSQSKIVVSESIIQDCVRLPMTRNRVNRFDGSTQDGALYSEISAFDGNTVLEALVRKDPDEEYLAIVGILKLVLKDISKGYIAIGGNTAIGRGVFSVAGDIEYSEPIPDGVCEKKLYQYIMEHGGSQDE